jgi:hypothetical protein
VERRADEPTITSDEAPRPADVIGDEVRTTLIGVANAVTVEFTMLSRDSSVDAVRMVCNHLVNDVWCLVDEALRLNGRSAARSARVVFEHAVTLATVADDAPRAQRYEMHEAIGVLQAVDNGLGENLLERKERDKERRRLARLKRKSAPIATAGTANFGPKFARQWSDLSVYDMADALGWADRYENGYRLLSSVTHGAAAGVLGTKKGTGVNAIYRQGGPSLEWVPLAVLEMLRTLQLLVAHGRQHWTGADWAAIDAALDEAFTEWPRLRAEVHEADRKFWPPVPVPGRIAVLGLFPVGDRWYLYEPMLNVIAVAEPPTSLTPQQVKAIGSFRDTNGGRTASSGRPITMTCEGVTVVKRIGARWVPASSVFESPEHIQGFMDAQSVAGA